MDIIDSNLEFKRIHEKFFLALTLATFSGVLFAQGSPQSAADQPYTSEYYYKVQWGRQQEFLQLFVKNRYPLLQRFEILLAHWDLAVTDITPAQK